MLFSPQPRNPPQPTPLNNDGISALSSTRTSDDMETYGGNLDFMNSQEAFDTLFPSKQPLILSTTPGQDFPIEEPDTKFKYAVEKWIFQIFLHCIKIDYVGSTQASSASTIATIQMELSRTKMSYYDKALKSYKHLSPDEYFNAYGKNCLSSLLTQLPGAST